MGTETSLPAPLRGLALLYNGSLMTVGIGFLGAS